MAQGSQQLMMWFHDFFNSKDPAIMNLFSEDSTFHFVNTPNVMSTLEAIGLMNEAVLAISMSPESLQVEPGQNGFSSFYCTINGQCQMP